MDLLERLGSGQGDFLLFGITPPKASAGLEDLRRIADSTLGRLQSLNPDGVILYDILEERDRNPQARPFPFLPTLDPAQYLADHLTGWNKPAVVYRAVGKYPETDLQAWLQRQPTNRIATVLVGSSSSGTFLARLSSGAVCAGQA